MLSERRIFWALVVVLGVVAMADTAHAQGFGGMGGRGMGGGPGGSGFGGRGNQFNTPTKKDTDRKKPLPKLAPMQPSRPKGPRTGVDRIAAVIEEDVITIRELEKKAQPYMQQLDGVTDAQERDKRRVAILKQVLNIEIDERIMTRELSGSRDKLGVTEADVDRAVADILKMNNITEDKLQAALYSQGMTWAEYRKKLKDQIERARLVSMKVQGRVQVKEAEVLRRCEERARIGDDKQVCAQHVLLRVPDGAPADEVEKLMSKATKMRQELTAGADFAKYANTMSDDKASPDGKLCFGRGEMVEEFEKAVFALKQGEISPVVRTAYGFHIIRLMPRDKEAKPDAPAPVCEGDALNPIRQEIYQEEMERQMAAWMAELRSKAFIDVRL